MRVSASEELLIHKFGDEAIVLDLRSETYYTLNETGIRMWQALSSVDTVEAACEQLQAQYNIHHQTLWQDLQEFIEQLKALKLIEVYE